MNERESKRRFLLQSSWLMGSSLLGLVFTSGVHVFAPCMGEQEYGLFSTLVALVNAIGIPFLGVQTVFTHQAAGAKTAEDRARLAGTARTLLLASFGIWALEAGAVVVFQRQILGTLVIPNPLALWLVVAIGIMAALGPVFNGILVGHQNFLWFGLAQFLNGFGRFAAVGVLVGFCGAKATGAIAGALIGAAVSFLITAYQSRTDWLTAKTLPCEWRPWLAQALPLTVALGAYQSMFSLDVVFVRALLGEDQTGFYNAAGMFARGMVALVAPLASVMFPKLVNSLATGRRSNALALTLVSSGIIGILGVSACWALGLMLQYFAAHPVSGSKLLPPLFALKLQHSPDGFRTIGELLPWFAWAMFPLILCNVLLNNLLARQDYRCVSWSIIVVAGYAASVVIFGTSFTRIIQILGIFNLVFLGMLVCFNRKKPKNQPVKVCIRGASESYKMVN